MGQRKDLPIRTITLAFVGLSLLLSGCATAQIKIAPIIEEDVPAETTQTGTQAIGDQDSPETVPVVVDGNNRFALRLHFRHAGKDENLLFSPYSISSALAMVYEGADGATAEEMRETLGLPDDQAEIRSTFATLHDQLNRESGSYELSTANSLWAQNDYPFLRSYLNVVSQSYRGTIANLDFRGDPDGSRRAINGWVKDQTRERIKALIPRGGINRATRLILANAIYLKADWQNPFEAEDTMDAQFKLESGKAATVRMMNQTDNFNYGETPDLQILEMDYAGDDLLMLLVLPKDQSLGSLEGALDQVRLDEWTAGMAEQQVQVSIPKFKLERKYSMKQDLEALGMVKAFKWPGADFTRASRTGELSLDAVIHQTYIQVDEEGTEAAAATAAVLSQKASLSREETKRFRADHPFIFLIRHRASTSILFMGRVSDPTKT